MLYWIGRQTDDPHFVLVRMLEWLEDRNDNRSRVNPHWVIVGVGSYLDAPPGQVCREAVTDAPQELFAIVDHQASC